MTEQINPRGPVTEVRCAACKRRLGESHAPVCSVARCLLCDRPRESCGCRRPLYRGINTRFHTCNSRCHGSIHAALDRYTTFWKQDADSLDRETIAEIFGEGAVVRYWFASDADTPKDIAALGFKPAMITYVAVPEEWP